MDIGASQQCIIYGCNFFLSNDSELLNHFNFLKLILQMYFWLSFPFFFLAKIFFFPLPFGWIKYSYLDTLNTKKKLFGSSEGRQFAPLG